MTQVSAPGKAILFGEHAVVYDQPALAVPLTDLYTTVTVQALEESETPSIHIDAKDIEQSFWLHERDDSDPIVYAIHLTLEAINVQLASPLSLQISSQIPIASGLGSGAATSIAIIRAIASHFGISLADQSVSELAFQVEQLHHGTPSGIDNNVIALERPLYYVRGQAPRPFSLVKPLTLILGHCGIISRTGDVVSALRERYQENPEFYLDLFEQVGAIVEQAFKALMAGEISKVGTLMDQNHTLLQKMGVSIGSLDQLVESARCAGALGAKLSGAGAGGFMIAAVDPRKKQTVIDALRKAGAHHTLSTQVMG
jgi:mevalonate kinase